MARLCARKGAKIGCSENNVPNPELLLVATRNRRKIARVADLRIEKGARLSSAVKSSGSVYLPEVDLIEGATVNTLPSQIEVSPALVTNLLLTASGKAVLNRGPMQRQFNYFNMLRNRTGELHHENIRNDYSNLHDHGVRYTLSTTSAKKYSGCRTTLAPKTCAGFARHNSATGHQNANRCSPIIRNPKPEFLLKRAVAVDTKKRGVKLGAPNEGLGTQQQHIEIIR